MYLPKLFEETDPAVLHALVRAHPLGTWVTQGENELVVNHVPFLFDTSRGPHGTLLCHVARANTLWQSFSKTVPSVIVFQGADAYVTPSWYASKALHGKVVPTWNYAVVHAHGIPVVVDARDALLEHLMQLTTAQEQQRPAPWQVTDAPPAFIEQMMNQVVAIQIPVTRLIGKWKVSQNRSPADRAGVISGLQGLGDADSNAMADLVQRG
jgi:transcriptional regulator